jgi:hypothetical protein
MRAAVIVASGNVRPPGTLLAPRHWPTMVDGSTMRSKSMALM